MTDSDVRCVTVEREISHPPEKIWRALTTRHLIEEWLMKNDFGLDLGHRFQLRGDWGHVDCEILDVDPGRSLSYTWNHAHDDPAYRLDSKVTFTLEPTPPAPCCAWNRSASVPTRSRPSAGPRAAGRSTSKISRRS